MKAYRFSFKGTTLALALLAFFSCPPESAAQLSRLGLSNELVQASMRGVDGSYDPRSDTYLMVGGNNAIYGICVGADGKPKGAHFILKPLGTEGRDRNAPFGAFPRARYSPDIDNGNGGFLVVWSVEAGATGWGPLHTRIVSCTSGILGVEQIVDPNTAFIESGPAIAYSETSKRFLVVWNNNRILAKLVDNSGAGVGTVVQLSAAFGRDPGATWNPVTNEFGVSFSGEIFSAFVRVPPSAPNNFQRTTFNPLGGKTMSTITDVDYNTVTNTYLMTWFESGATRVAELDAAGNLIAQRLASITLGSYDALSLSFNPRSGNYLLVGVDHPKNNANIDAVIATELDGHGVPIQADFVVSTNAPPARYPRVVASTQTKSWNVSWSGRNFAALTDHVVHTGSPDVAPKSSPLISLDRPTHGVTVIGTDVFVAGWAVDTGATQGTGVDAVHAWAWPVNGGDPTFVGAANYGAPRPDVAAAYGMPRLTNSGFNLVGSIITPGTYLLAVYSRSTVAGAFNHAQAVHITVRGSRPFMSIDWPGPDATVVGAAIVVAGWALDAGSTDSSGVDAVHIWAFPVSGAPAQFFGVGTLGGSRPDVGTAFGGAPFNAAGFVAVGTLPPGDYDLAVFARSTLAGVFNNVRVVRVHVQ